MSELDKNVEAESQEKEVVSKNFIEQIIEIRTSQRVYMTRFTPDSHRNQTDICTSDMRRVLF